MILFFYYGLLFLGTLSISDGVATFLVIALVDFFILKAIWESYEPIVSWRKKIKEQTKDWREWWKHLSGLKKIYFVLIVLVSPIFIASFALIFPQFIIKINAPDTTFYNLSVAIFAILSGIGALFGFYTSTIRTETAEQGLITERINKAVEGLGKSNLKDEHVIEVRIGALFALERIAQDSIRDHIQIMEILCAYIRHNSSIMDEPSESYQFKKIREDTQTALTIIGRRETWAEGKKYLEKEKQQNYRIDLRYCTLRGAQLDNTNFSNARFNYADMSNILFSHANLSNALLNGANLSRAQLDNANLSNARINGAKLNNASLSHANLSNANLSNTDMSDAFIYSTNLSGANLNWANLNRLRSSWANMNNVRMHWSCAHQGNFSNCKNLTQEQLDTIFSNKNIDIPEGLIYPKHWLEASVSYEDFKKACYEWRQAMAPFAFTNPQPPKN